MKKLLSVLLVVFMVVSLCSVSVNAEYTDGFEVDSFYVYLNSGDSKVNVTWDNVRNAQYYEVCIDTELEYHCERYTTTDTFYDWVPDSAVTPLEMFEIIVYAYDSNGILVGESNCAQANIYVSFCDYLGYYGDVDDDQSPTVIDATVIQTYLANKHTFDYFQTYKADVDGDCEVSIMDATYIQQYCANIKDEYNRTCEMFMLGYVDYGVVCDQWWVE